MLTALHTLEGFGKQVYIDPKSPNYKGELFPKVLKNCTLYDIWKQNWMFHKIGETGSMLPLKRANTSNPEPHSQLDFAAFVVPNSYNLRPGKGQHSALF